MICIYIYDGWWFQTFFILHNICDNPSHWLSYFSRWLKLPTRNGGLLLGLRLFDLVKFIWLFINGIYISIYIYIYTCAYTQDTMKPWHFAHHAQSRPWIVASKPWWQHAKAAKFWGPVSRWVEHLHLYRRKP